MFQLGNAQQRIAILDQLYKDGVTPAGIVEMAVSDSNVEVRHWLAKYATFMEDAYVEKLLGDSDEFVSTAVFENAGIFSPFPYSEWMPAFRKATRMQRFAIARNPRIGNQLVETIFNYHDQELDVTKDDRAKLICAFLSNVQRVQESREGKDSGHFRNLWVLAIEWLQDNDYKEIGDMVFERIGTSDDVRADTYQKCTGTSTRFHIIIGCDCKDRKTLALASEDSDSFNRKTAIDMFSAG